MEDTTKNAPAMDSSSEAVSSSPSSVNSDASLKSDGPVSSQPSSNYTASSQGASASKGSSGMAHSPSGSRSRGVSRARSYGSSNGNYGSQGDRGSYGNGSDSYGQGYGRGGNGSREGYGSRDGGYGRDSYGQRDNGYGAQGYSRDFTNYGAQAGGYNPGPSGTDFGPEGFVGETVPVKGILEVLPDYGVLRQEDDAIKENLPKDVYISQSQIRRFALRMGDVIEGVARPPKENERYLSLLKVEKVEGLDPETAKKRPLFEKLTPVFPNEWVKLETVKETLTTRLIDLISPIGKGQRTMIVAPPKAGKTWLLKDIANGITTNYPDVVLMVALIGERPEEVTDMQRSVKGEVVASNFDESAEAQTKAAEIVLERAKRLSEAGKDVVILMDSLTRLARAYNMTVPPSGRTLSGGFDPSALYPPKHFFGAARNFESAGSLTIIATALVDTGSRMDDLIYEEFKGTGNMELHLDRSLAERRIYPSIDIKKSSTRHEELLYDKPTMDAVYRLRRMVDLLDEREATQLVLDRMRKTKDNQEFLKTLSQAGS